MFKMWILRWILIRLLKEIHGMSKNAKMNRFPMNPEPMTKIRVIQSNLDVQSKRDTTDTYRPVVTS